MNENYSGRLPIAIAQIPDISYKTANLLIITLICASGRRVLQVLCKFCGFGLNSNRALNLLTHTEDAY